MTSKLHIAMLSIHSSPLGELGARDTGGMSVYILALSRMLGEKGHRLDIFTARKLPENQDMIWLAEGVRLIYVKEALEKPSGAFVGDRPELSTLAAWIARFRQKQEINYSLIHSNYWLSGVVGEQLAMTWGCPHVMTFHTLGHSKKASSAGHEEDEHRLAAETQLIRSCTTILVPNGRELQRLCELNGEASARFALLGCGVDLERFRPRQGDDNGLHTPSPQRSAELLFVGRFDAMKGLPDLLASLAILQRENIAPRLRLIGGDGAESPAWQSLYCQAEKLGVVDQLVFQGRIAHELLPEYYRGATAVVLPSHYESFGLVTLEALACGTPVTATMVGIAGDVIVPGINGDLAEPGEPKSMARAIMATLTLAAETSSAKIRRTVLGFDWRNVADRLEAVYYNDLNTFKISIK